MRLASPSRVQSERGGVHARGSVHAVRRVWRRVAREDPLQQEGLGPDQLREQPAGEHGSGEPGQVCNKTVGLAELFLNKRNES